MPEANGVSLTRSNWPGSRRGSNKSPPPPRHTQWHTHTHTLHLPLTGRTPPLMPVACARVLPSTGKHIYDEQRYQPSEATGKQSPCLAGTRLSGIRMVQQHMSQLSKWNNLKPFGWSGPGSQLDHGATLRRCDRRGGRRCLHASHTHTHPLPGPSPLLALPCFHRIPKRNPHEPCALAGQWALHKQGRRKLCS